jgi:hypothetical protein
MEQGRYLLANIPSGSYEVLRFYKIQRFGNVFTSFDIDFCSETDKNQPVPSHYIRLRLLLTVLTSSKTFPLKCKIHFTNIFYAHIIMLVFVCGGDGVGGGGFKPITFLCSMPK